VRRGSASGLGWALLLAVVGLLLGTAVGRLATGRMAVLAHPFAFGPNTLSLGALSLSLRVDTDLLGLVGAAAGVLLAMARR
jgi:hypothetical protein